MAGRRRRFSRLSFTEERKDKDVFQHDCPKKTIPLAPAASIR
jgi:hypothetical protein